MRNVHYRNIGFPKTGTNWLWMQLMSHPEVDGKLDLIFKEYRTVNPSAYKNLYDNFNVSVNLDTHLFSEVGDNYFYNASRLHEHTTHISMTFRNPYEVLNSMFNMEKNRNPNFSLTSSDFTSLKEGKMYVDMDSFFSCWEQCKLSIRYQFYDDLVDDPKRYFEDLCQFLGLTPRYDSKIGIKFKTQKNEPLLFENSEIIQYINSQISLIEEKTNRDLSHWKKE